MFQPARRNQSAFPLPIGHGFVMSTVLLYPKSRGSLTLASADPAAAPIIDPNLFADPDDFAPLLRALRISRQVFASPAFALYRAREFPSRGPRSPRTTTSSPTSVARPRRVHPPLRHLPHGRGCGTRWSTPSFACAASRA